MKLIVALVVVVLAAASVEAAPGVWQDPWQQQSNPWQQQSDPWQQQSNPWQQKSNPWQQQSDPWQQQSNPWQQKSNPWQQQSNPWQQQSNPWQQQNNLWQPAVQKGHHEQHIQVPAPHPIPPLHPEPLHLKVHDHPNQIHYKSPHVPHPHLIGVETHVPEPEIKHVKHGW